MTGSGQVQSPVFVTLTLMVTVSPRRMVEGTVLEYKWINPHSHITIQVPPTAADKSTVGTWDIEGGSTNIMTRQGWTRASYKAGDPIKLVAHPMKDGSKGASLFYVIMPDGKRLYHDIARPKGEES